jgi:hypothetical protein
MRKLLPYGIMGIYGNIWEDIGLSQCPLALSAWYFPEIIHFSKINQFIGGMVHE